MARLTPTATRLGQYSVQYTWSGTSPYYVYQDGQLVLDATTATTYTAQTTDGTTNPLPAIEVHDSATAATIQSSVYSPLVRIQWRGQTDASYYLIEQYIDSEWTAMGRVRESGAGYYAYTTTAQEDGATVQLRVTPVDTRGYEGLATTFTHVVVCNPAPYPVTYSYNAGTGNVTVADGA